MRTSIATVCVSGSLEEKMFACARAGFDGIEIFEQDLVVSPMSPEEVRATAERLGLTLDLYQPLRDVEGVDPETFAANLRRAEAKFKLMGRLGIDVILLCTNVGTATINDDELFATQIRTLGELAAGYGIRIAYEALAWGKYVSTYRHAYRIVEMVNHPNVGTCLDSFHILSRGDDACGIEELDSEKIFFVQLADAPALSMDILSWSRHYRVFPGEGAFDLTGFLVHLARSGYDGPVSLEIFNDVFRQSNAERTAIDGLRSLLWLQDRAAEFLAGEDTAMALTPLPRGEAPSVVDFAEVRTDDSEAVADVLAQLGFEFRGQHRRKPVQLWVQGGARVVINFQHARNTAPRLSALGMQVHDPVLSGKRAVALKAHAVPRHNTEGEQALHGVRAPDSTEVFFSPVTARPAWMDEFGLPGQSSYDPAAALIQTFDHINLAQPWQAFDESVLFYTSALRLETRSPTEFPSPLGLVRSQVMRTVDGAVRLALNIVPQVFDASPTVPQSYPEHIAFGTTDIVAVAHRARAAGMSFLSVPHNYYDDLAARFDLEPGELETLEELNLLYDSDEHGSFLHFYTETVGEMFLEVVERRQGYDGYGAPNAPVRLASQFERNGLRAV